MARPRQDAAGRTGRDAAMSRAPLSHAAYLDRTYIPELDGLRALSVLLVVSVHMYDAGRVWHWLCGGLGVTVFFLLSGYLISSLALREEDRRGAVSLSAFYVRRGLRIFPLYYCVLGLYALLLLGLGLSPHLVPAFCDALPAYLLYFQEVPFYRHMIAAGQDLPFFQSWSLGIEEKFYLVWPLLAFVLWRGHPGRRRTAAALLTAAFTLGPAVLAWAVPEWHLLGRCLSSYAPILAGCLLALLLHDRRWFERLRGLGRRTPLTGAAFAAAHFARPWLPDCPVPFGWDALYWLAGAAFLTSVLLGDGPVQRLLRGRVPVFVGKLSYGIYLIHIFGIAAAHRLAPAGGVPAYVLACVLATAAAWVLSVMVERPCIELGRRWSRRLLDRRPAGLARRASEGRTTHAGAAG
jgi:peptidoglycan/LPS O-acetylase OafA/YrhL